MFRGIKLGGKMSMLSGFMILMLLVVGGVGYYFNMKANENIELIFSNTMESVEHLEKASANVADAEKNLLEVINSSRAGDMDSVEKYIGKIGKDGEELTGNIATYEKTTMDQLEKEKLAAFKENRTNFGQKMEAIFELSREGKPDEAYDVFKASEGMLAEYHTALNALVDYNIKSAEAIKQQNLNESKSASMAMIQIIIAAAAICIAASYFITRGIVKAVLETDKHLDLIARGDLSRDVDKQLLERSDEMGQIAKSMQGMQEGLRSLLESIRVSAGTITESSENLSKITNESTLAANEVAKAMQEVAQSSTEQAGDAENVAIKATELGDEIEQASRLISDMNTLSDETAQLSMQGSKAIELVDLKVDESNKMTEQVSLEIQGVYDYSKNIESIVAMIDNIASQTNLLALNASIEAARAGDAGRGFAVVAEEIRKLSEGTESATSEIKDLIVTVQKKSHEAVNTMEDAKAAALEQNKSVTETRRIFEDTLLILEKLNEKIDQVSESAEKIEMHKGIIIDSIHDISALTEETSAATEQTSASTQEQLASIEEIESLSEELSSIARNMDEELGKFKF